MLLGDYELKFWQDKNLDKSGNVGKELGKGEIASGCIKRGSADMQGGYYWRSSLDISLWTKPIEYFH